MKSHKQLIYFIFVLCLIQPLFFSGCKPERKKNIEVYKPNIYIYPEEYVQLKVTINFPLGGNIIKSIPDYGNGWEISVDTSGIINNEYTYLFYESSQPDIWQRGKGWIVEVEQMETFFSDNMSTYGFEGKEIGDFVDYWIPRLKSYDYYLVYPQTSELIEDAIQLNFSEAPDHILRLFYLIEGVESAPEYLATPDIEDFSRVGYFVTEWGVIL